MAITDKISRASGLLDFGGWIWNGFVFLTGLSGAAVMAWLTSQLAWFWGTFQWAGVLGVGIITWLLIGLGLNLYRHYFSAGSVKKTKQKLDVPQTVVSGKHFRNEVVKLDGYVYSDCEFTNVTFQYDGEAPFNFSHNRIFGAPKFQSGNQTVELALLWMRGFGMLRENIEVYGDEHLKVEPPKMQQIEQRDKE